MSEPLPNPDDPQAVYAIVARFIRRTVPKVKDCWIGFRTLDGFEAGLPVDMESAPEPVGSDGLNGTERAILEVLRESPVPMKRRAVARRMGRTDDTGSFGVAFRKLVTGIALAGNRALVFKLGAEYTDDPKKFSATGR